MKVQLLTALLLAGCHTSEKPVTASLTCHSKDALFSLVSGAVGGEKIAGAAWRAGETVGWRLQHVDATAPIRKAGFEDTHLLSRVCGLSIDQFVKSPEPVCCNHPHGAVFQFRRPDDTTYEVSYP